MTRDYVDYVEDIVDSMTKAEDFVRGLTYETFIADEKTIFAVIRALEVIGEAAKKVPDSLRSRRSDVPWKEMAAMRDKLIHEYFGVKLDVVWQTMTEEIPALIPKLACLLKEIERS